MSGRSVEQLLERTLGQRVTGVRRQSGGCVGDVCAATLADGRRVIVKTGAAGAGLDVEGRMLGYLAARSSLPVPGVLHAEDTLLVMELIEAAGRLGEAGEVHAADLLADLHAVSPGPGDEPPAPDAYGLGFDTLIGGLHQPNPWTRSWASFFADHRLRAMGEQAAGAGRLPARTMTRLDRLADRVGELIGDAEGPSLIHGDVWSGNVLARDGRVAGFIDPAISYADPEIELAFISLFGTFGRAFYDRYRDRRGIREGFFETRCTLYNLYPLLVHARLFGGGYASSVESSLSRLGF